MRGLASDAQLRQVRGQLKLGHLSLALLNELLVHVGTQIVALLELVDLPLPVSGRLDVAVARGDPVQEHLRALLLAFAEAVEHVVGNRSAPVGAADGQGVVRRRAAKENAVQQHHGAFAPGHDEPVVADLTSAKRSVNHSAAENARVAGVLGDDLAGGAADDVQVNASGVCVPLRRLAPHQAVARPGALRVEKATGSKTHVAATAVHDRGVARPDL